MPLTVAFLAAALALSPPLPPAPEPAPTPAGRVLTLRWLHVGVRPAAHVSRGDVSLGVTVQITLPLP